MHWRKGALPTAIAATVLLSGCGGASSSSIARPALVDYPAGFQRQAARELDALPAPCALHAPGTDCSAIATMIEDYGELRARLKAR